MIQAGNIVQLYTGKKCTAIQYGDEVVYYDATTRKFHHFGVKDKVIARNIAEYNGMILRKIQNS